jgi:hypothetical protein
MMRVGLWRTRRDTGAAVGRSLRFSPDSMVWPAAAALAFTLTLLLSSPLHMRLGWDESVYASQISRHVPSMPWEAERARGLPLLLAPVTLVTESTFAIRCYLAVLAGVVLFLALLAWRGTRPGWQLGLAGVIFGGLGVTQMQAYQLFPNYWIALGCLAGAGLTARTIRNGRASWPTLALLVVAAAFTALMRPTDALAVFVPLLVLAVLALRLRAVPVLLAGVAGLIIGAGEWAVEAQMYFGGLSARLKSANSAVGGTHLDLLTSLRILDGDSLHSERASSLPGHPGMSGVSHPWLLLWWAALLALIILGVLAARRTGGWYFALVPVIPAVCIYLQYSLVVRDNMRYLQPAWAMLAVPAAEGIGWLAATARPKPRPAQLVATAAIVVFLLVELVSQHVLAVTRDASLAAFNNQEGVAATALQRLGVRAPCVVTSNPHADALPVAYYAHCSYVDATYFAGARPGQRVVVLIRGLGQPPPPYAAHWHHYKLAIQGQISAYISPPATAARGGNG